MNWQAKITGLIVLLALVVMSCERDDLTVGFPPKSGIFETSYFEFTPQSDLFWRDSVYTSFSNEFLVGGYDDPNFGRVSAQAYSLVEVRESYIYPLNSTEQFDSAELTLVFNYLHGYNPSANHKINIYQLDESQTGRLYDLNSNFLSFQSLEFDSLLLSPTILLDSDVSDEESYADTVKILLPVKFSKQVFDSLVVDVTRNAGTKIRSTFNGLAFVPDAANQGILGIDAAKSKISFYYTDKSLTEPEVQNIDIIFSSTQHNYLTPNKEVFDRTGTPLENLTVFNTSFDPGNNKMYYQNGQGIKIGLEFGDLDQVRDTLDNIVITNAILEISNLEGVDSYVKPPFYLDLFLTNSTNKTQFNANSVARKVYANLKSDSLTMQNFTNFSNLEPVRLIYDQENNKYSADISRYIQSLVDFEADLTRLYLSDPNERKTLDQIVIDKSNIKVKIFYTTRLTN